MKHLQCSVTSDTLWGRTLFVSGSGDRFWTFTYPVEHTRSHTGSNAGESYWHLRLFLTGSDDKKCETQTAAHTNTQGSSHHKDCLFVCICRLYWNGCSWWFWMHYVNLCLTVAHHSFAYQALCFRGNRDYWSVKHRFVGAAI